MRSIRGVGVTFSESRHDSYRLPDGSNVQALKHLTELNMTVGNLLKHLCVDTYLV